MSRFYADIEGQAKTMATRRGSEQSGIRAHIRGWNIGVQVIIKKNDENKDEIYVYKTGGSNAESSRELLVKLTEEEEKSND